MGQYVANTIDPAVAAHPVASSRSAAVLQQNLASASTHVRASLAAGASVAQRDTRAARKQQQLLEMMAPEMQDIAPAANLPVRTGGLFPAKTIVSPSQTDSLHTSYHNTRFPILLHMYSCCVPPVVCSLNITY